MATGLDLKLKRVAKDVLVKELADAYGVTDARISRIESDRRNVTPDVETRYVAALDKCVTKSTSTERAA